LNSQTLPFKSVGLNFSVGVNNLDVENTGAGLLSKRVGSKYGLSFKPMARNNANMTKNTKGNEYFVRKGAGTNCGLNFKVNTKHTVDTNMNTESNKYFII
jgi:hypothetical protein